jgi:hypothetical protein
MLGSCEKEFDAIRNLFRCGPIARLFDFSGARSMETLPCIRILLATSGAFVAPLKSRNPHSPAESDDAKATSPASNTDSRQRDPMILSA